MHKLIQRHLSDSYRKNKDDVRALACGLYPRFVYRTSETLPKGEIPVFLFHSVEPEYFESQLRYLADNGYNTVHVEELLQVLTQKKKPREKSIALTFDDGRGSLWSIAYPLLKKYGFSATSFIVPFSIKEETKMCPNLEDVWSGRAEAIEAHERELKSPLCTWAEIREMHESGTVDFQCHTSHHNSVFINHNLIDFINPSLQVQFLDSTLYPVIRKEGCDVVPDVLDWGHPIYQWAPSMAAEERFLEDDMLTDVCVGFVRQNGGMSFFNRIGWRKKLHGEVRKRAKGRMASGRYQSREERLGDIRRDLVQSREAIEERLNTRVGHLCYPWFAGSAQAVEISKDVGYVANYWGIVGKRTSNSAGTDPYYISRIDGDYIFSLPGKGRMELYRLLSVRVRQRMHRLSRRRRLP